MKKRFLLFCFFVFCLVEAFADSISVPIVSAISVSSVSVSVPSASPVGVVCSDSGVADLAVLRKFFTETMADKTAASEIHYTTENREALAAWREIYEADLPDLAEVSPVPSGLRMIAEVRTLTHLANNLSYYKEKGYNAALVAVLPDDTCESVRARCNAVRNAGLSCWFAWSGPDSRLTNLYPSPDKIRSLFSAAAPLCAGFLPSWRRTGCHLLEQDAKYTEWLCATALAYNGSLLIVGEAYWGSTHKNKLGNTAVWTVARNCPRKFSGTMIMGIAISAMPIEAAVPFRFGDDLKSGPCLGVCIGSSAWYAEKGRTFAQEREEKEKLEQRFLSAGCSGTITLHGDLSDFGKSLESSDDIGAFPIQQ